MLKNHTSILRHDDHGFTILEMLAVLIIIGILVALVLSTYSGIQRNQRNQTREHDIKDIYVQLEAYYVEHSSMYPTLSDMNNKDWLQSNMKTLDYEILRDPSSSSHKLVSQPTKNSYAYKVTSNDGSSCDDIKVICTHYTLTAELENNALKTYVKSSLY